MTEKKYQELFVDVTGTIVKLGSIPYSQMYDLYPKINSYYNLDVKPEIKRITLQLQELDQLTYTPANMTVLKGVEADLGTIKKRFNELSNEHKAGWKFS